MLSKLIDLIDSARMAPPSELAKLREDQPRDPNGEFASSGGGSASGGDKLSGGNPRLSASDTQHAPFGVTKSPYPSYKQVDALKVGQSVALPGGYTVTNEGGTFSVHGPDGSSIPMKSGLDASNSAHAISTARSAYESK